MLKKNLDTFQEIKTSENDLKRKALSLPPSKTELPAASCHFLIRSKYEHYIKMVPPY
jgi:hypothetical protein